MHSTRKAMALLPGRVWLTETGALYRFTTRAGVREDRPSQRRQARALRYLFGVVRHYRRRIPRVDLYQWLGTPRANRWDSGLLGRGGRPRRAYHVLLRERRHIGPRPVRGGHARR
jgi:hypothetical protein